MRWAGHVACMGEEVFTEFWREDLRERENLEDTVEEGRVIFKRIFKKWNWGGGRMYWIDLAQNRNRQRARVKWGDKFPGS